MSRMRAPHVLCVLALAGCGSAEKQEPAPSAGAPIPGGGLSIQEAIDSDLGGPLMVRGYLIERDGELRFCEAILESYPPQCGEPSLRVEGQSPGPSEQRVSLLGEVEDEEIRLVETASG